MLPKDFEVGKQFISTEIKGEIITVVEYDGEKYFENQDGDAWSYLDENYYLEKTYKITRFEQLQNEIERMSIPDMAKYIFDCSVPPKLCKYCGVKRIEDCNNLTCVESIEKYLSEEVN